MGQSFSGPIQLRLTGRPNEIVEQDLVVEMSLDCGGAKNDDLKMAVEFTMMTSQRVEVVKVSPTGTITSIVQPLRLLKVVRENGQIVRGLDTANRTVREKFGNDPEFKAMLAALDTKARIEQDARGRTIDMVVESPNGELKRAVEKAGEEAIAGDVGLNFPQEKVDVNATWDAGERDFEFPTIGTLKYHLKATLAGLGLGQGGRANGERVVLIDLKGDRFRYKAVPNAKASLTLEHAVIGGHAVFSVDKGRVLYQEVKTSLRMKIQESDSRTSTCSATGRSLVQDVD